MTSGITFIRHDPAGHTATPAAGSWKAKDGTAINGQPGTGDYPVSASCKICRLPIRLDSMLQMEWEHAPAPTLGSAS